MMSIGSSNCCVSEAHVCVCVVCNGVCVIVCVMDDNCEIIRQKVIDALAFGGA